MRRRSIAGPLIKSIIFIAATALLTAMLALSIANTGVGNTSSYNAKFTDVSGLIVGDSVRIAGVRVGQVQRISVADRKFAQVRFSVKNDRQLPASVTASIRYLNLVGQRYIELEQGAGPMDQTLPKGGTIPLERTNPVLNLTQLFTGFRPLFEALSPKDVNQVASEIIQVLQGEGGTVQSLIATVGRLTSTLAGKDKVIGDLIDNLTTVVDTVNGRQDRFTDLITTLRQLVHGFATDRKAIGASISHLADLSEETVKLLGPSIQPLTEDIRQLGRLSENLNRDEPLVEGWLKKTPGKMTVLARTASYGSWINFYMCQATVRGVRWKTSDNPAFPKPTGPPPTGIPITESRCTS